MYNGMFHGAEPWSNTQVTVELRQIVESGVKVWEFEYPSFYTGDQKAAFEQKVLDHYWTRQIGQETVGRWLHHFRTKVREIMPRYIKIYKLCEEYEKIEDPFESYSLTETYKEDHSESSGSSTESNGTRSGSTSSDLQRKFSNTPGGSIENLNDYMSEATVEDTGTSESSESTDNLSSSSEGSGERSYTLDRRGNIGVQPLGQEFTQLWKSYIDVDQMIIDDLGDLFLKVY